MNFDPTPLKKTRQPKAVAARLMRHDNPRNRSPGQGAIRLQLLEQRRKSRAVRLHDVSRVLPRPRQLNGENPFLRTQLQRPDHRAIVIESGGRGHLIYRLAFHQDPLRFEQTSQRIPLGRRSLP